MLPSLRSSSGLVFVASGALVLSGLLQLFSAYVQYLTQQASNLQGSKSSTRKFSYEGDDYPNSLESVMGELGKVALTLEDSFHYTPDGPHAEAEWWSIYPGSSQGFVYLGPQRRFFGVSVFHQIHCLDALRMALQGKAHSHRDSSSSSSPWLSKREVDHSAHCLNYLRQAILCNADMTLEPESSPGSRDVGEGLFATHVCKDWSKLYQWMEENSEDEAAWRKTQKHGNVSHIPSYDTNATTETHSH